MAASLFFLCRSNSSLEDLLEDLSLDQEKGKSDVSKWEEGYISVAGIDIKFHGLPAISNGGRNGDVPN